MDEAQPSHTGDQAWPEVAQQPEPSQGPPADPSPDREPRTLGLSESMKRRLEQHYLPPGETVDQIAADAAARRAGHKGLHHFAGHPSARQPWAACGEWRPRAGVRCPVCPDVCPGCGSHYVNPFPVDPRDG